MNLDVQGSCEDRTRPWPYPMMGSGISCVHRITCYETSWLFHQLADSEFSGNVLLPQSVLLPPECRPCSIANRKSWAGVPIFFLNLGSYWKWIHKQRNEFQTYLKGLPLFTIDSGLRIETNLTVFSFIIYPQYPRQQLIPDIILHYSILRLVWFCDQNNFSHNVTLFPQWNANS